LSDVAPEMSLHECANHACYNVIGAGTLEANGHYVYSSKCNDRPYFVKEGDNTWTLRFREFHSAKSDWAISQERADGVLNAYMTEVPGDLPPTHGWMNDGLDEPVPTVKQRTSIKRKLDQYGVLVQRGQLAWKALKFSDAEIVCDSERIPVHRSTLCAASPVFDAAFSSKFQEDQKAVYEIKDSSPVAVKAMLAHVYTGEVPQLVGVQCTMLLELAVQYQLDNLCDGLVEELITGVMAANIWERVTALRRHSEHPRVRAAVQKMADIIQTDRNLVLALLTSSSPGETQMS